MASVERSCAARACTPPTSSSGARPPRPGCIRARRQGKDRRTGDRAAAARADKAEAELAKTKAALIWEKHTRSWRRSPRARSSRSGRSGDQPSRRRTRRADLVKKACSCWPSPGATAPSSPPVVNPATSDTPNALTTAEQKQGWRADLGEVCDKSVAQTWPRCWTRHLPGSMSTMHRLLRAHGAAGERRRQPRIRRRSPSCCHRSRQVWSWTSPSSAAPAAIWFQLYVVLDIYSRYVVAWTVQRSRTPRSPRRARAAMASRIPERSTRTGHLDDLQTRRPTPLDLGVDRSHPATRSNDNPYSEAASRP